MGRRDGRPATARAAGNTKGVNLAGYQAEVQQWHGTQQHRGREAAGMSDVRTGLIHMFRQCAGKLVEQRRRTVRMSVYSRIGFFIREPEVGRCIDHGHLTVFLVRKLQHVRNHLGDKVYETIIPRNVRVSEAPSFGKPVLLYDHHCAGAQAYIHLAGELLQRERRVAA